MVSLHFYPQNIDPSGFLLTFLNYYKKILDIHLFFLDIY